MKYNSITQKRAKTLLNIFHRSRHKFGLIMFKMPDRKWKVMYFRERMTIQEVRKYNRLFEQYLWDGLIDTINKAYIAHAHHTKKSRKAPAKGRVAS